MSPMPEGNAIIYCEGAFATPNGKTAHGLIRRTERYRVLSVIDSRYAGKDAGKILDGIAKNIPIFSDLDTAFTHAIANGPPASHFVIGLAPDGGRLSPSARADVIKAIQMGLNVDSGLHDFLSEDSELVRLAKKHQVQLRDVRKTPPRNQLHFFEGKIEQVDSFKIAVLGTDSAIGKRTTAWMLVDGLRNAGYSAELIGTGQTAWMQGAHYSLMLDSLINDFLTGEIEHAVWSAWNDLHPDFIVIEGQGSLLNPAYPGGYEILAAARPDAVILQHAPTRRTYDGFPNYHIQPLEKQITAIEMVSEKPVIAIAINHEGLSQVEIPIVCRQINQQTTLPAVDVLVNGATGIVSTILQFKTESSKNEKTKAT